MSGPATIRNAKAWLIAGALSLTLAPHPSSALQWQSRADELPGFSGDELIKSLAFPVGAAVLGYFLFPIDEPVMRLERGALTNGSNGGSVVGTEPVVIRTGGIFGGTEVGVVRAIDGGTVTFHKRGGNTGTVELRKIKHVTDLASGAREARQQRYRSGLLMAGFAAGDLWLASTRQSDLQSTEKTLLQVTGLAFAAAAAWSFGFPSGPERAHRAWTRGEWRTGAMVTAAEGGRIGVGLAVRPPRAEGAR